MRENESSAWASTTHAENTWGNGQTLCVDWVTASFIFEFDLQQFLYFIGIKNHENLEIIEGARYGFAGYHITYRLGVMEFMHNEKDKRWLINFSGQACREYELSSSYDFVTFFALLANLYATYTRLDIAIDDFKNIYNVNVIRNAVRNKRCVTRLKEWGDSKRGLIEHGDDVLTMDNFYLGSSNSRFFINVYDKKLERENKKFEVVHDTWTRTEIRFKNEYAEKFVRLILENSDGLGANLFGFLNEKICFLTPEGANTKNKSRAAQDLSNHARWWRKFLNTTKKLKLTVYKPDLPLVASKGWLLHQVSTTLALFNMYLPEENFEDFVRELVLTGIEKMDKKHLKRLERQRELDEYISTGQAEIGWMENVVIPANKKVEKLSAYEKRKQKEKYEEKVFDVYYSKFEEQLIEERIKKESSCPEDSRE